MGHLRVGDDGSRLEEYEGEAFDLAPQPGRSEGHEASVARLLAVLEGREDFHSVRLAWASGLLMAVRATPCTLLPFTRT